MTFRRLFRPTSRSTGDIRRDVDDEITFHLEMRVEELRREGLDPAAARARASAEFGERTTAIPSLLARSTQVERRRRIGRLWSELRQDVRYGARLLLRSPGFSLAAIATLTVAIGANTAVFSVVNALLLKPVPAAGADRLLRVHAGQRSASWPVFEALRERSGAFSEVIAFATEVVALGEPGATRRSIGESVSSGFFPTLGVGAARGRTLGEGDRGLQHVVLSDRAWRVHFHADESIVGRRITLDHRPFEVVGVMPPLFRGLTPPGFLRDFWVPVDAMPSHRRRLADPGAASFEVVGRLRDGITVS